LEAKGAVAAGGGVLPAGEVGDAAMPAGDEMLCDSACAAAVVGHDGGKIGVVLVAVEEHDRDARGLAPAGEAGRDRRRPHEYAVDLIVDQGVEHVVDRLAVRRGEEDQDVVAARPERLREDLEHERVELVVEMGHDQPDQPAASDDERAGERIRAIAENRGGLQNLGAGLGGDGRAGREGAADRRLADASKTGHVAGGGLPGQSRLPSMPHAPCTRPPWWHPRANSTFSLVGRGEAVKRVIPRAQEIAGIPTTVSPGFPAGRVSLRCPRDGTRTGH
jgi:hypothetical protein